MHKLYSGPLTSLEVWCQVWHPINLKKINLKISQDTADITEQCKRRSFLQSGYNLMSGRVLLAFPPGCIFNAKVAMLHPYDPKGHWLHLFQREHDLDHRNPQKEIVAKVKHKISFNPAAPKAKRWTTLTCERSRRAEPGLHG